MKNAKKIGHNRTQTELKAIIQKYPQPQRSQTTQPQQIQIQINLTGENKHSAQQIAQENYPLPQR